MIKEFKGRWYVLSNDFPARMSYGEHTFPTLTHALAVASLVKQTPLNIRSILNAPNGSSVRKLLRKIKHKPLDSEKMREVLPVMLYSKFTSNRLGGKLLETGTLPLINENQQKDVLLGTYNGVGENILGQALMDLREQFRRERGSH